MRISTLLLVLLCLLGFSCQQNNQSDNGQEGSASSDAQAKQVSESAEYAIVIHGGAGSMRRENMNEEQEKAYLNALNAALDIGESILSEGGSSLDAVEQTIMYMENSPLFNAGKGAVLNFEGSTELDASIMTGGDLNAGAVGGVSIIKNPIRAARAVMENSDHVLLTNKGADNFASGEGLDTVPISYFYTDQSEKELERIKKERNKKTGSLIFDHDDKYGTVGCVALDKKGNITAGTSTGGMSNKRYNRIGDSPIIGAGTYANNATCGVSCTGHGEYFIRYAVAYDVSALMDYKQMSVKEAADFVINDKLKKAKGAGGLIALDKEGNVAMPFNTTGMFRGYAKPNERVVGIN
jgi:beta-aspartyl-peptidase (threonine type)